MTELWIPERQVCTDCGGDGILGYAPDGRPIACETCGGHEDSAGLGYIETGLEIEKQ
jgi:hypothetical protein